MLNLVIISDAGAGQGSGRRMERPREHWAIFWVEKRSPVFSSDSLLNHPVAFQKAAAGRSWWVSLSSFHPVCLWVSQILQIPVACRYTTFTVPCTEKRSETGRACGRLLVRVLQRFIFHCLIKISLKISLHCVRIWLCPHDWKLHHAVHSTFPRSLSVITCGCQKCCCRWQKSVCC